MVAGTSIGAFVGAVYATEADPEKTVAKCREWSMVRSSKYSNQLFNKCIAVELLILVNLFLVIMALFLGYDVDV